jgi:trimeric autotransporter adhesin
MFCSRNFSISLVLVACYAATLLSAQETSPKPTAVVPSMVNFPGTLADSSGKPMTGVVGVTFLLYRKPQGGAPLWMETQNVRPDKSGYYSVMLGSTAAQGLPADLFVSGEARWLGVQISGQPEQPRVLLTSVPYAMKAADAETLGGLPLSAFVLATAPGNTVTTSDSSLGTGAAAPPAGAVTGSGTAGFVPLWTSAANIGSSALFQLGTGATAKIGLNTTTPVTPLDIKGAATVRGNLSLPMTGVATPTAGKNSQTITFTSSVFNASSTTPVNENFRWQAEPVGNNTTAATGSLNLLYSQGTGVMAETGLKFSSNGRITFAAGQSFPGTGRGTITGVTAGADLTGGGISGIVTLNLDTTKVPLLNSDNSFNGSELVSGGMFVNGVVEGQSAAFGTPGSGPTLNVQNNAGDSAIEVSSVNGPGVYAVSDNFHAVMGLSSTAGYAGIFGQADVSGSYAIYAIQQANAGQALWAENSASGAANGAGPDAVHGISHGSAGAGVAGINDASGGIGVYGRQLVSGSFAGRFDGDVWVNGNLSKNGGSFKIDHPLDPSNKYLYHSFVESPDMKNIYDGVVTLDANGEAVVPMPDWFGALNRDFRYQLTCIGGFAPVFISEEIANNQFEIGGGKPGMKVSWQVTGTRQDAWANAHRIPVEVAKPADERGTYLTPELFGAPESAAVGWGRYRFSGRAAPGIHSVVRHHASANRASSGYDVRKP